MTPAVVRMLTVFAACALVSIALFVAASRLKRGAR